jgi:hypothetical protein
VLLPVLDDAKHYWVSPDEVDKLIRAGEGWLAGHPERDLITHRYLSHQRHLSRPALERLAVERLEETDDLAAPDSVDAVEEPDEGADETLEAALLDRVRAAVGAAGLWARSAPTGCCSTRSCCPGLSRPAR